MTKWYLCAVCAAALALSGCGGGGGGGTAAPPTTETRALTFANYKQAELRTSDILTGSVTLTRDGTGQLIRVAITAVTPKGDSSVVFDTALGDSFSIAGSDVVVSKSDSSATGRFSSEFEHLVFGTWASNPATLAAAGVTGDVTARGNVLSNGTAQYAGRALGSLRGDQILGKGSAADARTFADVTVSVDFAAMDDQVTVAFSNTQWARIGSNDRTSAPELDRTITADFDTDAGGRLPTFSETFPEVNGASSAVSGSLFGPNGEEIGGVYTYYVSTSSSRFRELEYTTGFGAKRQ